mmetsp:Transcript_34370/g.50512  ORF Transcript_34370/g.50512 Transcript_34370/m.50512 type:complete len:301 (+) Transcript_34370:55-957(+)|eukprot:CAMPEP_0195530094 /NCGR_PEP_ID=MMETSP0794_2-20130614/32853_1 /TAXON_ID=515487 /ORGANISM="Stephanopyxis turris, Strain CCMP 815" /LENGTH=300 /DNA_ID=CAMNT_0040661515 /DNA_START=50 /DNA_END=952 /DNA_ORIENTATION=+
MSCFGTSLLRTVLALWVSQVMCTQLESHVTHPNQVKKGPVIEVGSANGPSDIINTSLGRDLGALNDYELLAGGFCTDTEFNKYQFSFYMVDKDDALQRCAAYCDEFPDTCKGFDVNQEGFCYVYASANAPPPATPESLYSSGPQEPAVGDIVKVDGMGVSFSCFRRRTTGSDDVHTGHVENYDFVGPGTCRDAQDRKYKYLIYHLGGYGQKEDCAEKCDGYPNNLGFVWEAGDNICMCQFNKVDLPWNEDDPEAILDVAGACRFSGGRFFGECGIDHSDGETGEGNDGMECYKHKHAPVC